MRGALHTVRCILFGYCRVQLCERHDQRPGAWCLLAGHPLSMKQRAERINDERQESMR